MKSLAAFLLATFVGAVSGDSRFLQDSNCTEIMEVICDNDGEYELNTLCQAIQMAGIEDEFDMDTWTVFAPVDAAFNSIPSEAITALMGGPDMDDDRGLADILAFHAVGGVALESTDLRCDGRTFMANEEFTVTICEGDRVFQTGIGNPVTDYPEIVVSDIETCNGYVHLISGVML